MRVWAWVAAIGSLIMSFFAIRNVVITVPRFSDPCFQWGDGNRRSVEAWAVIKPGDPCRSRGGTSESKTQAIVRMLIVSGGILLTAAIGILAIFRLRPVVMVVAGSIWIAGAFLLWSLAPLALLTGAALMVAAARARLSTS
jgi:hypothetical protein